MVGDVGERFGRLTVIKILPKSHRLCLCDCGQQTDVYVSKLKSGHTQSCGCYNQERRSQQRKIEWKVTEKGCWECTSHKPNFYGYPQYMIRQKNYRLSRIIYAELFGPIPEGLYVLHSCDNPLCINPEHLSVGTAKDNSRDMVTRNRHAAGERSGQALLTKEKASFIRRSRHKIKGVDLAKMFGVSPQTICGIQKGRAWLYE